MYAGRPVLVRSELGLFHILGFDPCEGEDGMTLTVETFFDADPDRHLRIRLVIGYLAIATRIRSMVREGEHGPYLVRAECTIPPFSRHIYGHDFFPIKIEALDAQDEVVDAVVVGDFEYWEASSEFFSPSVSRNKVITRERQWISELYTRHKE